MKLSIFGLGYVGTVSAACFAQRGHVIIGMDTNAAKVALINEGKAPVVEKDIDVLVAQAVVTGTLRATSSVVDAVAQSDISIVCVGTPSAPNGNLDTRALQRVAEEIGMALRDKAGRHTVVIRSTILPGTFRSIVLPALVRASGKAVGVHFDAGINPEFLREGSAVADFNAPDKTVIGADPGPVADLIASLYEGLPGTVVRTTPEMAEFAKYVDNVWHALKVGFANEVGNLCKSVGIDSHDVMDIFMLDRKLNISTAYLRPGFAFGGSCLPKDTRALNYFARTRDLNLPILNAVLASNEEQINRAIVWVLSHGKRDIALLGCSFKAGTDDLRESPYIILAERLLGRGCRLRIYDRNVNLSMLMGANRDYIHATIPHIANMMVGSLEEAVDGAQLVILATSTPDHAKLGELLSDDQILLDFARMTALRGKANYHGVNW